MTEFTSDSDFVTAAVVAAELFKAREIANNISLTASNARALALRAGQGAAGFRAITDFIDMLADSTVKTSDIINMKAVTISELATNLERLERTIEYYSAAAKSVEDCEYVSSILVPLKKMQDDHSKITRQFYREVDKLSELLESLSREIKTASVLSAMSRVEASQSGKEYEDGLNVVADNVSEAADKIQRHIMVSRSLCFDLADDVY
ncbi:chemotaxis protein [Enterovibrio sp. ZSDZ35]|uniref:Chemotaxis protein n=1 Tax=Enterovibrio qingdaonensis TaxID=2899818 RepID=A0ABT5QRW3_9GAMM|nr:chemotaxis protein [Enterovibrio sp. ZSDZ35]MDD1783728.1 chemotaxis protein [Enterovibrio sp. ZSDZ35]